MKNTTSFKRYVLAAAVSVVAMLATGMAQADTVKCADPMKLVYDDEGKLTNDSQDRQYQTTSAIDCVWGGGNIGQGGGNDDFLLGNGTNDVLWGTVATAGPKFGLSWTLIDSKDASGSGIPVSLTGLTIGSGADNNTFSWTLTDIAYGKYALGLKDGGDPKWAVFLLSDRIYLSDILTGIADITTSGSWSHIALYGTGTPPPPCVGDDCGGGQQEIPEPGTLALVGLALLGGAALRRRKV